MYLHISLLLQSLRIPYVQFYKPSQHTYAHKFYTYTKSRTVVQEMCNNKFNKKNWSFYLEYVLGFQLSSLFGYGLVPRLVSIDRLWKK